MKKKKFHISCHKIVQQHSVKPGHLFLTVLDAQSMPKDEEYEKGCVKGNMVYKIHWTDPPTLMPVESMCGHIPQVSILDTKEVIYHTCLSIDHFGVALNLIMKARLSANLRFCHEN